MAVLLESDRYPAGPPVVALGQCTEPLALSHVPAHRVGVGPERERRIGVAELPHHRDEILADREEERGEGVTERVRGDPRRQRSLTACLDQFFGADQDRSEDPQAHVVLCPRCALVVVKTSSRVSGRPRRSRWRSR